MTDSNLELIASLPLWRGEVDIDTLTGGMTNVNFKVTDGQDRYVVRLGEDDSIHLISRANELASCRAAFEIGVSPEPVYHQPGVLVVRFVDGRVFDEADVRDERNLRRIVETLRRLHAEVPARFDRVPVLFWVFQVLRHYQNLLLAGDSAHHAGLSRLGRIADRLEAAVGPVDIRFGHNDLLAANFIDDGERIWLIDFDYAGFNSPLFDLSNLASNNQLGEAQQLGLLQSYFGGEPRPGLKAGFHAMKCASLLRETMWSMVSELHSRIDMDFAEYTQKNLQRFEAEYDDFRRRYPSPLKNER